MASKTIVSILGYLAECPSIAHSSRKKATVLVVLLFVCLIVPTYLLSVH